MTTPCCKAILVPCPKCESHAGKRCIKPSRHGGVIYRKQCHVTRSNSFAKICALLDRPARAQYQGVHTFNKWYTWTNGSVAECLRATLSRERGHAYRITLLDGTVVREWPAP